MRTDHLDFLFDLTENAAFLAVADAKLGETVGSIQFHNEINQALESSLQTQLDPWVAFVRHEMQERG